MVSPAAQGSRAAIACQVGAADGRQVSRIFVQRMKTKWGSCNPHTHNARFIALMDPFMPKWQGHRKTLNRLPVRQETWGY
jgi:predicted metal-dependent hydrolase